MYSPELAILLYLLLGGGIGCIPILLLFVDYRRRHQIHLPFIWLAAFGLTFAVALPVLLAQFGLWLALIAPGALFAAVFLSSKRRWHS